MWIYCKNVMYSCDEICIFSIITPVFSVTWSSEIILIFWFAAQETFLIIINVENSCAAEYVCGKLWHYLFFRIHRSIKSSKEQHLFDEYILFYFSKITDPNVFER